MDPDPIKHIPVHDSDKYISAENVLSLTISAFFFYNPDLRADFLTPDPVSRRQDDFFALMCHVAKKKACAKILTRK